MGERAATRGLGRLVDGSSQRNGSACHVSTMSSDVGPAMAHCRACAPEAPVAWCGVLSPPDGGASLTVTLCSGEAPATALRASCEAAPVACAGGRSALLARELLARALMRRNREALGMITSWLPPKRRGPYGFHAGSINYGVASAEAEATIDDPVPFTTSYSDVLAWLLLSMPAPSSYLEIGTSVGKNLHAIARSTAAFGKRTGAGVRLFALDLEVFNPKLLPHYPRIDSTCVAWATPSHVDDGTGSATLKADAQSSTCEHALADGSPSSGVLSLHYVSADLKTNAAWEAVSKALRAPPAGGESGFDLIFSDAWHSPAALHWEMAQLLRRRLLGRRSVVVWDDLNTPGMREAFGQCCLELRHAHPAVAGAAQELEGDGKADRIDCFLSAVTSGFLAANHSDIIGIAGPSRVLEASGVRDVLPSLLHLEDFGLSLPD